MGTVGENGSGLVWNFNAYKFATNHLEVKEKLPSIPKGQMDMKNKITLHGEWKKKAPHAYTNTKAYAQLLTKKKWKKIHRTLTRMDKL